MVSEYEKEKARNIERNAALLRSLGLDQPLFEPREKKSVDKKPVTKKRRAQIELDEDNAIVKMPRVTVQDSPVSEGLRRSSRTSGKKIDYASERIRELLLPKPVSTKPDTVRIHDPKTFGAIPDVEIGAWWASRMECSRDAIHAPTVAGISGGPAGAYSVALSGGYEDDVDLGYAFTYTGSGGRDLKGTKAAPKNLRTAPQSSDQSFENPYNSALKRSCETGKPVRVVRGFKLKSKYAPSEGYRYDGLYKVEKAWIEEGLNPGKYLVCKFAFKRLPGQPPLPIRAEDEDVNAQTTEEGQRDVENATSVEEVPEAQTDEDT